MLITCINNKCLRKWDYQGKSKSYVCCPTCSYRFKIQRGMEKNDKTMLPYVNITDNITPKLNIVKEKPNKSESYQKEEIKEVDNLADFNLAVLDNRLKNKSKGILEVRGSPEESPSGIKLCEEHKQSARYDSYYNKWVCGKCIQEKIDNPIKRKVIRSRGNLQLPIKNEMQILI